VNPCRMRLGGVRAESVLGVGSLILRPVAFSPMTFLAFQGGAGAAVALSLPAPIFQGPALGPLDEASIESALGVRSETATAGMEDPPSKPTMCKTKLSRVCGE
jgi:hypothetical protein